MVPQTRTQGWRGSMSEIENREPVTGEMRAVMVWFSGVAIQLVVSILSLAGVVKEGTVATLPLSTPAAALLVVAVTVTYLLGPKRPVT